MNFRIVPTTRFEKEAKKISRVYPDFKYDVEKLASSLAAQPAQGSHLGHGIYKVRIAITGKPTSKSYGARVIHAVFSVHESVYLITVYDKSLKKDLSSSELKEIVTQVKELRKT